jgi:hypothetical protein
MSAPAPKTLKVRKQDCPHPEAPTMRACRRAGRARSTPPRGARTISWAKPAVNTLCRSPLGYLPRQRRGGIARGSL